MDNKVYEKAVALRHDLHMHPYLSNEERPTFDRIAAFLKANSTKLEIVDKGHYIYAIYRSDKKGNPNIAFRADVDAIKSSDDIDKPYKSVNPGVGHQCGHDGHAAALAALALTVDMCGADRDVFFLFQPAEENGSGAISCLDFIKDNDIKEIYACHGHGKYYPDDSIVTKVGALQCASKGMIVSMIGVPAHAANPDTGKNPTFALCQLALYSKELLKSDRFKSFVLATVVQMDIGENEAFGVMASKGRLLFTIRSEDEGEMDDLQACLEQKARELAEADGLSVSFEYRDEFPETRNDAHCVEKILKACEAVGEHVYITPEPRRGSEDFGHYTKLTKGAMYYCSFGKAYPAIHNANYDFCDEGIKRIVAINLELIKDLS